MTDVMKRALIGLVAACALSAPLTAAAQDRPRPDTETNCSDRRDEDGDLVTDCADADCFDDPACQTAGGLENNDNLCSDFIDNDGDGAVDCDDADCLGPAVSVCRGSWEGPLEGTGVKAREEASGPADGDDIPELGEGMSVEDLIGKGDDIDGERNDFVCSDGYDNDQDGKVDCADIGCRFDPNVTVCRGNPGLRFSVVANVTTGVTWEKDDTDPEPEFDEQWDTRVNRIQLRAFGPVPYIQDSFFLLSIRAEATPRLTFAFFSMPIADGHFININSGGGGLSNKLVLSTHKNPMLDRAFYVYNAFEAGNGAAFEVNGPIVRGLLDYRTFVAGGSGRFNGNIGGRFFTSEERNFTWGVGGQLALYLLGRFDRWDTRFLYTEVPRALTLYLGGRYDQREFERYPSVNVNLLGRWWRFLLEVESYGKREVEFGSWQFSWNVLAAFLIWPKHIYVSADIGSFYASEIDDLSGLPDPNDLPSELARIRDEFQWRAALHFYVWRNTGLLSLLYTDRLQEAVRETDMNRHSREIRLEAQFRF